MGILNSRIRTVTQSSGGDPQLSSSLHSPSLISSSNRLHFQQSLLILIQSHFLKRLLTFPDQKDDRECHPPLSRLIKRLYSFFEKVGFVSQHFFESSFSAVKAFLETSTLEMNFDDLVLLSSITSFFKVDPLSVVLHVFWSFEAADLRQFTFSISHVIISSGLKPYFAEFDESESECPFEHSCYANLHKIFDKSSAFFLPRIRRLDIEICGAENSSSTFSAFCNFLLDNTTVVHLTVQIVSITTPQVHSLSEVFSSNNTLRTVTLSFAGDRLKDAKTLLLISALSNSSNITKIDLSNFPVRNSSVLLPLLKNSRLKSIAYSNCACIDSTILNDFKHHCSLTEVTFYTTRFVAEISEIFKFNTSLKKLELRKCDVRLSTLFQTLQSNSSLLELDLAEQVGTIFKYEDVQSLIGMILNNHSLLVLRLNVLHYDSFDIERILESLEGNYILKKVSFHYFHLRCLITFFKYLSVNTVRLSFDISPCFIDVKKGVFSFYSDDSFKICHEEVVYLQ
ncbi:hypothetical protein GEMRC1_009733 [Eukaryota sp. GEM-RC1]